MFVVVNPLTVVVCTRDDENEFWYQNRIKANKYFKRRRKSFRPIILAKKKRTTENSTLKNILRVVFALIKLTRSICIYCCCCWVKTKEEEHPWRLRGCLIAKFPHSYDEWKNLHRNHDEWSWWFRFHKSLSENTQTFDMQIWIFTFQSIFNYSKSFMRENLKVSKFQQQLKCKSFAFHFENLLIS